jgi:hypothetical protein
MKNKKLIWSEAWELTQNCMEWIGGAIYGVCLIVFMAIAGIISGFIFCFAFVIVLLSRGVNWTLRQEDEL